jgi:putative tricarboxylic transport membrane protein
LQIFPRERGGPALAGLIPGNPSLKKRKLQGETIFNAILAALGLIIMVSSIQIGFGTLRSPGSGLFPFLCGAILFCQNMIRALIKGKPGKGEPLLERKEEIATFLFIVVTLSSWILLMPLLGWLLATFLATLGFSKIMRLEGWRKPLILSAGNTALLYFLFGYCLQLDLPRGVWS